MVRPVPPETEIKEQPPLVDGKLANATLADLEAVRLLLKGGSVVDWHRLDLRDLEEVDRFLRVNEFDPLSERDVERLEQLRGDAIDYLQRSFNFRIPDEIAERCSVRELFLYASKRTRRQSYACMVLKTMHIIHHLAGRELLFRLPISDDEIFHLVEKKVVRLVEEVRAAGHPIIQFEWSRKPHDSLITKLLAKKSTLAASIYDKLRFRLVTRTQEDILPVLIDLTHRLIPFNYVVPGESVNDLIKFSSQLAAVPTLTPLAEELQDVEHTVDLPVPRANEFSGPGYRVINFVADLPVRIDDFICRIGDPGYRDLGFTVFVLTEFQIVDAKTAHDNEQGENSHDRYKERQIAQVKARLLRGMQERPPTDDG
jgi:uncharacterized protein (TIGR04552 family)